MARYLVKHMINFTLPYMSYEFLQLVNHKT